MVINLHDDAYPESLKNIQSSPQKLYVLGNEKLLNENCIAIVGSRVCTQKGSEIAEKFANKLSKHNLCIVSGMAQGIDTAAHIGALKAGGKTIAVLGSGFKHIFPKENINLFNRIIESGGAIVSENEENVKVTSQGFVLRNRIVSGLSMGVLVVEAKHRSGTSITADFAIRQGKKLFCIPHGLEEREGVGTNRLIKKGAKLVTTPMDILKELNIEIAKNTIIKPDEKIDLNLEMIDKEFIPVYKFISKNPINIDELCKKTKLNVSQVNYILTMLELEGFIKQLPGRFFVR